MLMNMDMGMDLVDMGMVDMGMVDMDMVMDIKISFGEIFILKCILI